MSWWPFGSTTPAEPAPNTVIEVARQGVLQVSPSPASKIAANAAAARTKAAANAQAAPAPAPAPAPVTNVSGATAPRDVSPIEASVRRGDYVALGGSRKSGKARKGKKSRKSKAKKSKKASKSRK